MDETEQLVYLYCIAHPEPELTGIPSLGDNLYSIGHDGLYAVVSNVEQWEFGEEALKRNIADFQWVKTQATLHEKTIEHIMTSSDVIPFKLGTLFNTNDSLTAMLDRYGKELKTLLRKLEDKEEWGVKIYCDTERLKASSVEDDSEIKKIDARISGTSPGKAFFLKKKKAELLALSANGRINEYGQYNFDLLRELSHEARINNLLPEEATGREDPMILNAAFLIDTNKVVNFLNTVDTLNTHYKEKGLLIDCSGPWPPYNFCDLSYKKDLCA